MSTLQEARIAPDNLQPLPTAAGTNYEKPLPFTKPEAQQTLEKVIEELLRNAGVTPPNDEPTPGASGYYGGPN